MKIKRTITNTSTNKGNLTFKVIGNSWNFLDNEVVPVEYTVTGCVDAEDALTSAMNMLCGYLYDWAIY